MCFRTRCQLVKNETHIDGRMEMDVLYLPRDVLELIPRLYGPCNPIVSKIGKKVRVDDEA